MYGLRYVRCVSHMSARHVYQTTARMNNRLALKNSKNSFSGSRVSTQPQLTAALSSTSQRAESIVVVNVVLPFLHTDLCISRLRRVVSESDHTHTTRRFFTRETCRSSNCAHVPNLMLPRSRLSCVTWNVMLECLLNVKRGSIRQPKVQTDRH